MIRTFPRWSFMALPLIAAAACASAGNGTSEASDPAIRGTIRIVGSAPVNTQLTLSAADGRSYRIAGPLAAELAEISGLEVEIWGEVGPAPDPLAAGSVEVERYRIMDIDGRPVIVGEVIEIGADRARIRTDEGTEVLLFAVPDEVRVGQRIWVQGPEARVVQMFGILRE